MTREGPAGNPDIEPISRNEPSLSSRAEGFHLRALPEPHDWRLNCSILLRRGGRLVGKPGECHRENVMPPLQRDPLSSPPVWICPICQKLMRLETIEVANGEER